MASTSIPNRLDTELPLISVVIPVYNAGRFIGGTLESVLQQTYRHLEIILVDDGSTDDSVQIIRNYQKKDRRVILLQNAINMGVSYSRNRGTVKAGGEYICFLDNDDRWEKEKIRLQYDDIKQRSLLFSCTARKLVDEEDREKRKKIIRVSRTITYKTLLAENSISCSSVMLLRELALRHPMKPIKHEDYANWLEIIKEIGMIGGLNLPLLRYTVRPSSISGNKIRSLRWLYGLFKKELKMSPITCIFWYVINLFSKIRKFYF
jgi:teichuronic acid biosynthesis glycosyltransferase TuaG